MNLKKTSSHLSYFFQNHYLESLKSYRTFYDDFNVYGEFQTAKMHFYFIPGINGTPGQIRFALPSLIRWAGPRVFIQCLFLKEFGANIPVWEKYTLENISKRVQKIQLDLETLGKNLSKLIVITSSNGFYDFLAAYPNLSDSLKQKLKLMWISIAPDCFEISPWVEVFKWINGIKYGDHLWVAVPNHNFLSFMNPETRVTKKWKQDMQKRVFNKFDLESRFYFLGAFWSYTSPNCFNAVLNHLTSTKTSRIEIPAYVLSAEKDGYWYGKPIQAKKDTLDKYLTNYQLVQVNSSHLWVTAPNHLEHFLNQCNRLIEMFV